MVIAVADVPVFGIVMALLVLLAAVAGLIAWILRGVEAVRAANNQESWQDPKEEEAAP